MWCYFFSEFCSGSITCWRFRRVESPTTHKLRHWWWPHYAKRQNSKKTKPKKNLLSNVTLECHRCPCLRFHRYPHRWHQSADGNLVMVGDDVHEIEREMNWQKLKIVNIAGASIETESTHKTARYVNAWKKKRTKSGTDSALYRISSNKFLEIKNLPADRKVFAVHRTATFRRPIVCVLSSSGVSHIWPSRISRDAP